MLLLSGPQAASLHSKGSQSWCLGPAKMAKKGEEVVDCTFCSSLMAHLHSWALILLHQSSSTVPLNKQVVREPSTLMRKQRESRVFPSHDLQMTESNALIFLYCLYPTVVCIDQNLSLPFLYLIILTDSKYIGLSPFCPSLLTIITHLDVPSGLDHPPLVLIIADSHSLREGRAQRVPI